MIGSNALKKNSAMQILKAVRAMEKLLWRVWGKAAAPMLMMCLDIKISITGACSTGRLLRKLQCLIWQGHLAEAEILAGQLRKQELTGGQKAELARVSKDLRRPVQRYSIETPESRTQITDVLFHLRFLCATLDGSSLGHAIGLCGRLQAVLMSILGLPVKDGEVACRNHPTQAMVVRSVLIGETDDDFMFRVVRVCPVCGRKKVLVQKNIGTITVSAESEAHHFGHRVWRGLWRRIKRKDWLKALFSL